MYMTWHRQLPEIIALDLIIGNSDRHCGNLFYDPSTDTFWAIDMDDTFNKDLCFFACKKLKSMMKDDNAPFTEKEICALTSMRNTLKILVHKYTPSDLIKKLYSFAKKAGFVKGSDIYDDKVHRKLLYYEKIIKQSHASAYQLISLLDKIVSNKSSIG